MSFLQAFKRCYMRLAVRAVKLNGFQSASLLFNFTESDLPAGPLDARLCVLHCKEICS